MLSCFPANPDIPSLPFPIPDQALVRSSRRTWARNIDTVIPMQETDTQGTGDRKEACGSSERHGKSSAQIRLG